MAIFVRVISGGQETTLTLDKIISINGIPYNQNQAPSESEVANRVVILETAYAALAHDVKMLLELCLETDDTIANQQGNFTPSTTTTQEG